MAPTEAAEGTYRIHGWRWHHLSILRDLDHVNQLLHSPSVCAAGAQGARARQQVSRVYAHVLDDNWEVHDEVERRLLYPWVSARAGGARQVALTVLGGRRRALGARRERLRDAVVQLGNGQCEVRRARAAADAAALRRAARAVFGAAERVVVPAVRALFSADEQRAFNRRVIRTLSPLQSQLMLVVFNDTMYAHRNAVATDDDRRNFESQVPRPIRALVPLWRKTFLAFRDPIR